MERIKKTLSQQMKMSDIEIIRRKELLDLKRSDVDALLFSRPFIVKQVDSIVERFYQEVIKYKDISLLISDADTLGRLHNSLRIYVIDLFSGYYDSEYVNNRLRIGMVHKRIGVAPKLFLSAMRVLKKILREVLRENIEDKKVVSNTLHALEKLLYFDTILVFDTYVDSMLAEVEAAKEKTELYAKSLEYRVAQRTKQLEKLSRVDPLTNLYNQREMYHSLRRELLSAARSKIRLSLVYFDVDSFKKINDIEGHLKGDEVLKSIGYILLNSVREVDVACRFGGDEFVLILPNCDVKNAKKVCEKIIDKFAEFYPDNSLSIGIAETGIDHYLDSDQLISLADKKMYEAKQESGFSIKY